MNDTAAPTRILLVDDEPTLREPLAAYLGRQGFAVREAASAAEARALLLNETPDLVLLDIMMPGDDGLSLCRHLIESKELPVILLTANGEAMDRSVGREIGADDYVVKPFEPRELVARIKSVLRRAARTGTSLEEDSLSEFEGWRLAPVKRRPSAAKWARRTGSRFSSFQNRASITANAAAALRTPRAMGTGSGCGSSAPLPIRCTRAKRGTQSAKAYCARSWSITASIPHT